MSNETHIVDAMKYAAAVAEKIAAAEETITAIEDMVGSYYNQDLSTLPELLDLLNGIYIKCKPFIIEPANETAATPERRIYHYSDMKHMPRGIEMKEYVHSDGSITFIGQYVNDAKNATPITRPKRVYRVELLPDMGDWRAAVFEDATRLVTLRGDKKWYVAYAALGALRGILHKRCVSTKGNRRARKAAAKKEEK